MNASRPRLRSTRVAERTRWRPIAESLRAMLASGGLRPGELVPSTRELAARHEVHRQTIMVALDSLCAEGLLEAEPRRGYRVAAAEPALRTRPRPPLAEPFHFRIRLAPAVTQPALDRVTPEQVFVRRYQKDHAGAPPAALMQAFAELLDQVEHEGTA